MFAHFELPDQFYQNDSTIRDCFQQLELESSVESFTLIPNRDTPSGVLPPDSLALITDGIVKVYIGGRLLYFLESGDVFLTASMLLQSCVFVSEFASVISFYPMSSVQQRIGQSSERLATFTMLTQTLISQLHILLQATTPPEIDVQPITRTYAPGDVIIIQDTSPGEVFTLLSGDADVYMREKKVGKVLVGEIFGAMAATGNIPRSASVIARNHCVALSLPKANFLELARTHPATLFKLIEHMSRIIVDLNERLAEER